MKNRMSIAPWPTNLDQHPPLAGTSHAMSAVRVGAGADSVELCETWRAWAEGTGSEFLNWFLFTPHGKSTAAEAAVLEDWICFKDGSSELNERARALLGDRLMVLRVNPAMRIVIGGLTGRSASIAHGMRLGLRRVLSIRTFLVAQGIHRDRIGIAVRGSGWSVTERFGKPEDRTSQGGECRLQITDSHWTLARN